MTIIETITEAVNDADIHIDKMGVVQILLGVYINYGIYKGITQWKDSKSSLAKPAIRLLSINAVLVVLVTLYKLTRREIAPLFVLQCLGHYSNFLIFAALTGFGSHPTIKDKGVRGDRRISLAIWALHLLYAVTLFFGFKWAECVEGRVYPVSFLMSNSLFLANYALAFYVKKSGFDIKAVRDGAADNNASKEDLALWNAQVAVFFSQQRTLAIWHFIELILGHFVINYFYNEADVTCDGNNDAWVTDGKIGSFFLIMHTVGVKKSLSVASVVFFPKKLSEEDKKKKE